MYEIGTASAFSSIRPGQVDTITSEEGGPVQTVTETPKSNYDERDETADYLPYDTSTGESLPEMFVSPTLLPVIEQILHEEPKVTYRGAQYPLLPRPEPAAAQPDNRHTLTVDEQEEDLNVNGERL